MVMPENQVEEQIANQMEQVYIEIYHVGAYREWVWGLYELHGRLEIIRHSGSYLKVRSAEFRV